MTISIDPIYKASQVCYNEPRANVAELVDALDLGSSGVTRESSSLSFRTKMKSLIVHKSPVTL